MLYFRHLTLIKVTLFLIFLLGMATAYAAEKTLNSGDIKIQLTRADKVAANSVVKYTIEVSDAAGNPVKGADLRIEAQMPQAPAAEHGSHGGGESGPDIIIAKAKEHEPGHYEASLQYNMIGKWEVFIGGSSDRGLINADFTEKVSVPEFSSNWRAIGTFIALIVGTGVLFTSRKRTRLGSPAQRKTVEEAVLEEA